MVKAIWNNEVSAKSDGTKIIEGNHYFPPESVNHDYLVESNYHTTCYWKGVASYYHVVVEDKKNENAAWYYPDTMEAADRIKNYIAFWGGVQVIEE
ncbi:MAG: DUF427 domain-containing protein, partial [Spirochaetota bacterium]